MSMEVERDALLGALRLVADIVESRNTIPVLGNLMLVAADGELTITGTDLDREASATMPAAGALETTIDARKLVAAIASLKAGKVQIEKAEDRAGAVTIKSGRSRRTLPTLPVTDFPRRKEMECATRFGMPAAGLLRLLELTHGAVSNEETRYYLNGVYVHLTEGQMRAVATDSHRLMRASIAAPDGSDGMPQVIIPTKAVTLLRKLLVKRDGDVAMSVSENAIEVTIGGVRLASKVVDGSYPDYGRVIPKEGAGAKRLVAARDALNDVGASVAAIVNGEGDSKYRVLRFDLVAGEPIRLSARDQAGALATDEVAGDFTGEATSLGINQKYLAALASACADGATLTMEWADARAPVRFVSDKDPDLVGVIMPMNA